MRQASFCECAEPFTSQFSNSRFVVLRPFDKILPLNEIHSMTVIYNPLPIHIHSNFGQPFNKCIAWNVSIIQKKTPSSHEWNKCMYPMELITHLISNRLKFAMCDKSTRKNAAFKLKSFKRSFTINLPLQIGNLCLAKKIFLIAGTIL